jgi:hypothetical protein
MAAAAVVALDPVDLDFGRLAAALHWGAVEVALLATCGLVGVLVLGWHRHRHCRVMGLLAGVVRSLERLIGLALLVVIFRHLVQVLRLIFSFQV